MYHLFRVLLFLLFETHANIAIIKYCQNAQLRGHWAKTEWFKDCATCPEMVLVPAGAFMMGSPKSEAKHSFVERPQHRVRIATPFAVGRFEVTFSEWDACIAAGGCEHKPSDNSWGRGRLPVIHVSWTDAKQYVAWLSKTTGKRYRLLTEAEWEYAARARTTTKYWWGDEVKLDGKAMANCDRCGTEWDKKTAPVGSFKPNAFGLHDVHGNVSEWVQDCYDEKAYETAPKDGSAAAKKDGCTRVLRGGSGTNSPRYLRAANRNRLLVDYGYKDIGFRVARTLTP